MNLRLKMAILKKFSSQADFATKARCHESKVSQVVCVRRKLDEKDPVRYDFALTRLGMRKKGGESGLFPSWVQGLSEN